MTAMRFALLPALAAAIAACAPAPYYVEYDDEYADVEPPAPYVEVIPAPPGPMYVWVPGYWWWTGRAYVWHAGRYSVPPAPGHVWVRSGWVHYNGRYRFVPGRWARPGRVPQHHYDPGRRPATRRPPPGHRQDRDRDRPPPVDRPHH